MKKDKLYKETNKKFVERTQNMLYKICGCNKERAKEVLEECLKLNLMLNKKNQKGGKK